MRRKKSSGLGSLVSALEVRRRKRGLALVRLAPGVERKNNGKKGPQMTDYFNLANRLGLGGRRRRTGGGLANRAAKSFSDRLSPTERAQIRREIDEAVDDDPEMQAVKADYKLRQSSAWWYRIVYLITKRFRKPVL